MITVALVDDHAVVREGYRALLSRQADIEVVGEYATADAAATDLRDAAPDVLVIDLNMPGSSPLGIIGRLQRRHPRLRCLVFTMYANGALAQKAFAAGAKAYVTKSSDPQQLLAALRAVAAGRCYVSDDIAQMVAFDQINGRGAPLDALSARETEVLQLLLSGRAADEIAAAMNLSLKTVRNLHYALKRKLGVRNDIELVRYCLELNLVV